MKKKTLFVTLLVLMMLLMAGCGSQATESDDEGSSEASTSAGDDESVEARLQAEHGDTEWFAVIAHIDHVQKLRHPVIEVHFDATVEEVRASYLTPLGEALMALELDSYQADVFGTDGPAGGFGDKGQESVELPAAPTDISGLADWMEAAYGPGSGDPVEDWYGHITGYDFETDAWDGEAVIVVESDIPYNADLGSVEYRSAAMIRLAVASAGIDWATNIRFVYADGESAQTGSIDLMVPYSGY